MRIIWHRNFDIDNYLNRVVPSSRLHLLPYPIAHVLGHRKEPAQKYGNLLLTIRATIGVFSSLLLIQLASHHVLGVATDGPLIVGSFGAAAVLEFYAIESPLAQPRCSILSQIIGTVIGISFRKLFYLHSDEYWVRWLGGALACAVTTAIMALTKTVHPPAGATALIAVVDDKVVRMGWRYIPLVLLGCSIMLALALILNNILTRFPLYWWSADDLGTVATPEKKICDSSSSSASSSSSTLSGDEEKGESGPPTLTIVRDGIFVPDHIRLSPEEQELLQKIRERL
ncbi:HPP family protein [Xylariaceae sp. FL0594]|nr:HPP family protein [Xylariaceae sp. FL0594]